MAAASMLDDQQGAAGPPAWRLILAGLCASLVGLGLARFAYTPLLPAIISAHWFSASASAYLGAANLAGYLAGAMLAAPLAARIPARSLLRGMMVVTTVALFACAWPVDFYWFFTWRFIAGVSGAALMVLNAPTLLPHIAPARRGLASGLIFMGVGIGIAASGTLVPLLLGAGVTQAWLGLGTLALLLTAIAWQGWPAAARVAIASAQQAPPPMPRRQLFTLYAEYALNAAGLVPHMIFLVVFIARGLGWGVATGAQFWVAFGLGAAIGPVLAGHLADRIGFRNALRLAYVVQAVMVALPIFTSSVPWLLASSAIVGAFTPGIAPLTLGRIQELLPNQPALHRQAWSRATTGFAILQAAGAYGMAYLLDRSGGHYALLFGLGSAAIVLALVVDLASGRTSRAAA